MMTLSIILVVGSGLMNAIWNLFAKRSKHKGIFLGSIMMSASIVLLPYPVLELTARPLPISAYLLLLGSMSLQALYAILLAQAYRTGELSQTYSVMRGTGVALVPLGGVFVLGESVPPVVGLGIGLIAAGLLTAGFRIPGRSSRTNGSLLWAFAVGMCIASYTVVDKLTLQYFSPLCLLQVSCTGFLLAHLPAMLDGERFREEWKLHGKWICLGSLLSPGSYLLFLFAMKMAPVSHLAPIREIGTVFATLFGILILKEPQGRKRLAGAFVITLGIIMISFKG